MGSNNKSLIKQFRVVGILESISYVLLLGIAMPLKYFANLPEAVRLAGSAHGFLFVMYIGYLLFVYFQLNLSFKQLFIGGLASLIPFGPHFLEKYIIPEQKA